MDAFREELSGFSSKSDDLCYAATLVSSPLRDPHRRSESSRPNHFDLLARHQPGSQVSQSDPDLFATKDQDASEVYKIHQWAEDFTREGLSKGQHGLASMAPVFGWDFSKRQETSSQRHVSFNHCCYLTKSLCVRESAIGSLLLAAPWMTSLCCVVRTTSGLHRRAEPRGPGTQVEGQEENAQGRSPQTGSSQPSRFCRNLYDLGEMQRAFYLRRCFQAFYSH